MQLKQGSGTVKHLKMLTGESCVSLNLVKRIAAWLLLIFFKYLHNQLSYISTRSTSTKCN